jgi:pilus assembly protein CpaB
VVRTSTFMMIGFAALFGVLAVFLAKSWLNTQAEMRMRSLESQLKSAPPAHTIVVAKEPLRFGDEISARALREIPWPDDALPAGAFGKISAVTTGKRVVLTAIDINEPVLATKITGPGQRATLSAMLHPEMKAVTVRVNDVEGVAGFVLPGDRVDVVVARSGEQAMSDVVIQNVRVLAVDQLADERVEKPSIAKAVTLEVSTTDGEKLALATLMGTLSLMLRKAGDLADEATRRVTATDLGRPTPVARDVRFITVGVNRAFKRQDYSVQVEGANGRPVALFTQVPAHN